MWLFRITQTHDGGLKVCAQACARRFGFCYPSSGELGHEMAGILYSSHVCAVSKWACFPTHTSNHYNITFIVFKNKLLLLNCILVLFLIVGMSPPTSNYSRLSCFSKINKSFFHSFYCFLHPQKKFPGPPITKERSRVAGTGYVRGFRSNNQSKVRLRLCTVLEQLLAANPQISEAQKMFLC